ncbi:MAG: glycosyltransferase family 1 protein [Patescibacteria group bacterium]
MKIAIDVSPIIYNTGVSIYTKEIVGNLLKIDTQNDYVLYGGSFRQYSALKAQVKKYTGRVESRIYPIPPVVADLVWNRIHKFPIDPLLGKVDVFHSSDWTQPPTKAFKVTTIHDLSPIRFPRQMHPRIVSVHRARFNWIKKEADIVIAPSIATKADLIDYGIREEKIRVIGEAASIIHAPSTDEQIQKVKTKYNIDGNYIVTVGVGQRKNTDRLIQAFEKSAAGQNLKLVLIGRSTKHFDDGRGIRFTGHVSDEEFAALISGSQVMVYPSLYEGFGLPILEAFNANVPVVTSNISSMPEVAGDAAVLVDPYEVESISEGIVKALKNQKGLKAKGLTQKLKFSWLKAAEKTLDVYKESRD